MNVRNMLRWCEALESGRYKQTTLALRKWHPVYGDVYCALGVACEEAIADGVDLTVDCDNDCVYTYDGFSGELPPKVRKWLGIKWADGRFPKYQYPSYTSPKEPVSVLTANDTYRMTFAEISALIREHYRLDLFDREPEPHGSERNPVERARIYFGESRDV